MADNNAKLTDKQLAREKDFAAQIGRKEGTIRLMWSNSGSRNCEALISKSHRLI